MAYLTCPFCNSQSFHEKDLPSRVGLLKFSCIGSDHTFYVEEEDVNVGGGHEDSLYGRRVSD